MECLPPPWERKCEREIFFQIWREHRFDRERDGGEREIISFRDEKEQEERIVQEKEEDAEGEKTQTKKEGRRRRRERERERERENSGEVCGAG